MPVRCQKSGVRRDMSFLDQQCPVKDVCNMYVS